MRQQSNAKVTAKKNATRNNVATNEITEERREAPKKEALLKTRSFQGVFEIQLLLFEGKLEVSMEDMLLLLW